MSSGNNERTPWLEWRSGVALALVFALMLPNLRAQASGQGPAPALLNIEIIEGEDAVNNIKQRVSREPVVQVTDENHKPVAGAVILATLPEHGAGGTFAGGAKTLSLTTDARGRATLRGFEPNSSKGKFQIKIQASFQGVVAQRVITQTNVAPALGLAAKVLIIVGVAAAGAAGGAIAATRGGSSSNPSSPTVITPGSPSVGGPH